MTRARTWSVGGLLIALVGCSGGGPTIVPVSGVITLDGKPYGKAVVVFQPVGTKDNPEPGRGSSAYTDESGRFVLKYDGVSDGAVVGTHLVRIMTKGSDIVGGAPSTAGSSDETPKNREVDPIPAEWNGMSQKTFDVPPGGTDKANFDITSTAALKKKK